MKYFIKSTLKKIPSVYFCGRSLYYKYRFLYSKYKRFKLKKMTTKDVFRQIHRTNAWCGTDSVSGRGSSMEETKILREKLPALFREYKICSVLDIPCGDFHWMKSVGLNNIDYVGSDIVPEIIEKNKIHEKVNIRFEQLDIIRDALPAVDLILSRDCLVHFSYDDIFECLRNIYKSDSLYLLTTTFCERTKNIDIATGEWRTLNLQIPPFCLPKPRVIIDEKHPAEKWRDKSLGLWKVADIKISLERRSPLSTGFSEG